MDMAPDRMLGHYRLVEKIGQGGMGIVWRAVDTTLDREVAIKVLPDVFAGDPARLARFDREAKLLASLNHPGIATIHGFHHVEGVRFLAMELVPGIDLSRRLSEGPIPIDEALGIALKVAEALEAAHESGVVHRDLKPANVQITPDGKIKILDFGLAKALEPDPAGGGAASMSPTLTTPAATRAGVILGTAAYMSPEQAKGKPVDRRADIWAFGCLLYEMLTDRRAFEGETVSETLAAVLKDEPRWGALPTTTPEPLRRLLVRCLEKDPRRRLRDVGDARLELEEAEAGDSEAPAAARPASRKRWSATIAWSVASAAVLVAAGALVRSYPRTPASRPAMRFSVVTNFAGVEAGPSLSPDGRWVAFVSNRDGQWDIYIGLVTGGSLIRITSDPNIETRPRWSPDGTHLLFARLNDLGLNDLWVVPALGGAARRIVLNGLNPTWSPDGRSIAYSSGGTIWVCEASGANPRAVTRPEPPLAHHHPAFSHDGRSLAFVRRRDGPYSELAVADVGAGTMKTLTNDHALALSPVWSPDDRFIYFTSSRGGTLNIWKIPAASGDAEQITAGQGDDADIDLSADGKRLVFSSYRANVNLAELNIETTSSARRKWLTSDAARGENSPRYSRDGRRIAYFSNREGAEPESIWVMDADGGNASSLVEDSRVNAFPRWTADGQELLFMSRVPGSLQSEREVRRISLAGGVPQVLPMKTWGPDWGDVAADGRLIYRTTPRAGELYDPRTNRTQPVADLFGGPLWSHDGQSFAFAVRPDAGKLSDAGLWSETPGGARRQIFRGWVAGFAWAGAGEVLVLEGKPDLKGVLWRVDANGQRRIVLPEVPLLLTHINVTAPVVRFDVHPDGRRIAIEALEYFESDIGMIDNVR